MLALARIPPIAFEQTLGSDYISLDAAQIGY